MPNVSKKKFIDNYIRNIPQILSQQIIADTETPVSTLLKISKNEKYSFLLESVEGGDQRGRYSLIGCKPDIIWKVKSGKISITTNCKYIKDNVSADLNPIQSLRNILQLSKIQRDFNKTPYPVLVGYLGYPMIQYMEKINLSNPDTLNIPEAVMIRPKIVAVFDNIKDTIDVMTAIYPEKNIKAETALKEAEKLIGKSVEKLKTQIAKDDVLNKKNIQIKSNYKKEDYLKIVEKAKKYIHSGDIFQVVPSQRFHCEYILSAKTLYRSLRRLNPSPFLVNLNFDNIGLVASSPEILVRVRDGKIIIRPIAGTRKRGKTTNEDRKLSNELLNDQKELAEHLMLLDLGRNDVGRVAKVGTVSVTEKMIVEYYSHVMHIVSNVEGDLKKNKDSIDALISGFPAGTVSGAPKIRAMEIIEELENVNRGFYGGAMGYFDSNGQMDTCISLRTGLIKDNNLYVQAGGGVVYDSDPEKEFQETINKAQAIIAAALDSYRGLDL
ncbi:MAG: anthranilate synthase component I [Pelagibacteraceae bacterium]|jgi:anthranilate synthase component 1|nr:anthranilate synthase component I [Pelagibacteraceae bacterium]HJO13945.1 anthranilate synthase component I [Alphaproteobacteria bacterium]MBO6466282.1 anthranilate synthase component I [Pelagibacteraceae bacterium]MBO6468124.1 anthranilate synthase component I [Pelagibacteraceae bacterium]MBO6469566.1 anthranilate synthase component I [Pelagibacteraceae bacterium]